MLVGVTVNPAPRILVDHIPSFDCLVLINKPLNHNTTVRTFIITTIATTITTITITTTDITITITTTHITTNVIYIMLR